MRATSPWTERLSPRNNQLIRYDPRGTGLSDWDVADISLHAWVNDLATVVDAAGLDRFPLFGLSQGCAVSVAYVVRNPERVSHLILCGGFALGASKRRPEDRERHNALATLLATKYRLPAVSWTRPFAAEGGLMSYGVDVLDLFRRAASYVDRTLKGAKPADLPVQQPTKFDFVINLKTAKALGLTVPPSLLAAADEVIE
jgi:pimeloyl-ACP methyl ester carboxylesterase